MEKAPEVKNDTNDQKIEVLRIIGVPYAGDEEVVTEHIRQIPSPEMQDFNNRPA